MTTDAELIQKLRDTMQPGGEQPVVYKKGMWATLEPLQAAINHLEFRARTHAISGEMNPLEQLAVSLLARQINK